MVTIAGHVVTGDDVRLAVQGVFIAVGLILAVVLGRLSMSQEIKVILDYCNSPWVLANITTGEIRILNKPKYMLNVTNNTGIPW